MALGTRLIVMLLAISVVITLMGFSDPDGISGQFGVEYNYTTDTTTQDNETMKAGISTTDEFSSNIFSGVANFFDRYINVARWIDKIFSFITAPIGLMRSVQAPEPIIFLVGGIWTAMWGIAIASFIWRKDL